LASWTIITASKLPIIFEIEDKCPVSNISPLPKLIFHETDCTKYYECKNGQKQLRSCKVGLYFSKRWLGCVTPEISECSLLTSTPVSNLECPVPDTCPPKLIPIKEDCSKYYECKDGKKHLRSCGADLYFSQKWQGCVEQQVSDCEPPNDIEQCPTTDACPPKLIPIKQDCTKYYECKNSKKELRFCKAGLYFSQYWQGCVSREHSDCLITTLIPTTQTPIPTTQTPIPTTQTPIPTTQTPIPTTQTPIPTTQTPIPTTQTPIPTTQTPIPTTQTPISTTSTSPECPYPDSCPPKLIPIKSDCTKYYECKNSKKELRFCKADLYFSQYWQGCVSRENSDCFEIPISGCINGDLLEHECTCTKYYLCIEGYKALFECPPGKHFDISTKTCQPGTNCLQVTPSSISSPTSIPITSQCIEGEYMPHKYECKKYYECKVNRKILRECNDGMIFNEALQTCVLGQC